MNTSTIPTLSHVPDGAVALALTQMAHAKNAPLLHITLHDRALHALADQCRFFAPEIPVYIFPAWDCLPYDRASPAQNVVTDRLLSLHALAANPPRKACIILTTVNAAMQYVPPRNAMRDSGFNIRPATRLNRDALQHYLNQNGYRRVGKAMEPGEYAVRGSIMDLIPPGAEEGTRIDLFGDEVESLRHFNPLSQISTGACAELALTPVSEILLTPERIEHFRTGYRTQFGAVSRDDPLYEAVSAGRHYIGMEHWLPLFYERLETIFDYVGAGLVTLSHGWRDAAAERAEAIRDYYDARLHAPKPKGLDIPIYHPLPPEMLYITGAAWEACILADRALEFSPFATAQSSLPPPPNPLPQGEGGLSGVLSFAARPARNLAATRHIAGGASVFDLLKDAVASAATQGQHSVIACYTEGSRARLATLLSEHGISCTTHDAWTEILPPPPSRGRENIGLILLPLEHGFETANLMLLSEQDVMGDRILRTVKKKKKSDHFMEEAASLNEGELVVHREHGIGRFAGLVMVEAAGAKHDCLKILYADDDKLFLPVENIDLLTRYGSDEDGAQLDKLGGASWQARKARMKQRITIAAAELMKTAAERAVKPAPMLSPDPGLYSEFCARFPYSETEDQARSIDEVLESLAAGTPMDRLVCGDVGFGKTEVALRAAFAVATAHEGKAQVALICPTTLLARQHYAQFKKRFDGLPVRVRSLSRLISAKEARETRDGLKNGEVDIVVGTHALLSADVKFHNLGLVIVDEEQHFGVKQKEKLKALKTDAHVLTMTATPIPRTLQLALSGVRDLSLITTPPVDRLAVRTFVMPFDPVVVREALQREHHRGGKTFIVTPRIKDIPDLERTVRELAPDLNIVVAHGQMAPGMLDDIMNAFYDGKADVLISTAIIESGIDIPTANTLIVNRSDLFGLSQLYQLRGRVGRGKTRAYAYFTLPHHRTLTPTAAKRLEVMQTLDTLGAGFSLASHDMDIRGFGNLVGEQQSGHVREVGIELYQQMLEEAIEAAKNSPLPLGEGQGEGKPATEKFSPQINLGLSVLIPEDYVTDLQLRLGLYKRASTLADAGDIDSFAVELVDRFGPLPPEVSHLLDVVRIKQLCLRANITKLDAGPKGITLAFHNKHFANPEGLMGIIAKEPRFFRIRPDQSIVFIKEFGKNTPQMLAVVRGLLDRLVGLL